MTDEPYWLSKLSPERIAYLREEYDIETSMGTLKGHRYDYAVAVNELLMAVIERLDRCTR